MAADRRPTPVATTIRIPVGIDKDVRVTMLDVSTFNEAKLQPVFLVNMPDLQLSFMGGLEDMFEVFTAIAAKLLMIGIANDQIPTSDGSTRHDQSQT